MEAVKFPEATKNLARPESMTKEECGSLWVWTDGTRCISCWKMTWKQRIKALFWGKVWLSVYSGQTQPPVSVDCSKTVFTKQDE